MNSEENKLMKTSSMEISFEHKNDEPEILLKIIMMNSVEKGQIIEFGFRIKFV